MTDEHKYADLTDYEQKKLLESSPNGGQTDNGLKPEDRKIEQPPQNDPNWTPHDIEGAEEVQTL